MNVNQTALFWLHLDYFQKNCEDLREEQGERFPQDFTLWKSATKAGGM